MRLSMLAQEPTSAEQLLRWSQSSWYPVLRLQATKFLVSAEASGIPVSLVLNKGRPCQQGGPREAHERGDSSVTPPSADQPSCMSSCGHQMTATQAASNPASYSEILCATHVRSAFQATLAVTDA